MGISFTNAEAKAVAGATNSKPAMMKAKRPPRTGNTKPKPVLVSLDQPGRLRAGHLLTLLSISSPTLYKRINAGELPKPDGYLGRSPYWNTQTVREFLAGSNGKGGGAK